MHNFLLNLCLVNGATSELCSLFLYLLLDDDLLQTPSVRDEYFAASTTIQFHGTFLSRLVAPFVARLHADRATTIQRTFESVINSIVNGFPITQPAMQQFVASFTKTDANILSAPRD